MIKRYYKTATTCRHSLLLENKSYRALYSNLREVQNGWYSPTSLPWGQRKVDVVKRGRGLQNFYLYKMLIVACKICTIIKIYQQNRNQTDTETNNTWYGALEISGEKMG